MTQAPAYVKHVLNGPKPVIKFGTRVSDSHPVFEKGDYVFETMLLSQHEERQLARTQEQFPKAGKDEAGDDLPLTQEQQDHTFTLLCDIMASVLRPRLLLPVEGEEEGTWRRPSREEAQELITVEWVDNNTSNGEFGELLYFLRHGHPQANDLVLTPIGHDPNAER